jgi:hypothetical protein
MELFLIYLWLKLDSVANLCLALAIISTVGYIIFWLPRGVEQFDRSFQNNPENNKTIGKLLKIHNRLPFIAVILYCVVVILPSSKDVAILVASSVAIDVAKSPEGVKLGSLLRGKANELLDQELNKLNKGK